MNTNTTEIRLNLDPTNPGQFFACCGLLELADRLWGTAEGWFENSGTTFCLASEGDFDDLIAEILEAPLTPANLDNDKTTPLIVGTPFDITLDWWNDTRSGGRSLKIWAGSMSNVRIALAMRAAMRSSASARNEFLNDSRIVYQVENPKKKVEPFYFDSRRGGYCHALDIGFSPNDQKMKSMAYPATEFLTLVGLQRARPRIETGNLAYSTWQDPIIASLVPVAVAGLLPGLAHYQFRIAKRSKDHSCFLPAQSIGDSQ